MVVLNLSVKEHKLYSNFDTLAREVAPKLKNRCSRSIVVDIWLFLLRHMVQAEIDYCCKVVL